MHWPPGWAERNLTTHYERLIGCKGKKSSHPRSSVAFANAFTPTTECSPSRASLLTSSYPTDHGVMTTPGALDPKTDLGIGIEPESEYVVRPNLMRVLSHSTTKQAGYDVAWKGKFHLTPPLPRSLNTNAFMANLLKWYGCTSAWNPPDAGHSLWRPATIGGGRKYNNDGRFMRGLKNRFGSETHETIDISSSDEESAEGDTEEESIMDFLAKHKVDPNDKSGKERQPFCLVASLVNPHDVWSSPCFSHLSDEDFLRQTGYHPSEFESVPIDLPPNHGDDLASKPTIQGLMRTERVFGDLPTEPVEGSAGASQALRYVRFYGYLHKCVDMEIGLLLDALEETGQMDETIIVRMADHGENALSHGLREKRMNAYDETMRIPLVINFPADWFGGQGEHSSTRTVPDLVSSIDILRTVLDFAGINHNDIPYRGRSLVPILKGEETANEDDEVLFTFDEPLAPPGVPGYIRCIRTRRVKYSVYFSDEAGAVQYEMYDLEKDPNEMNNLIGPGDEPNEIWLQYHDRLRKLMAKMGAVPREFDWDEKTSPRPWSHCSIGT